MSINSKWLKKEANNNSVGAKNKVRFYSKRWFKGTMIAVLLLLLVGGVFAYKTGYTLSRISGADDSALGSLFSVLPIGNNDVKTEEDGRTNILLLGMRGENIPGGGLLADTIMVASIKKDENKVALISIPRDLYVKIPGTDTRAKINSVHAYGEQQGKGRGIEKMKEVIGEVTGMKIHYAASINFVGFKQLVDAVGGVEVTLETPFYETSQFVQGQECGGEFTLPAGKNTLNGEKALCYARAREHTSDFDRARRQQIILKALKDKLTSLGTITDFGKLSAIFDAVGDNVRTDMSSRDMKNLFDEYGALKDAQIYQRVLENSEEGLLTAPAETGGAGYILIPRAGQDNYSDIHNLCRDIFVLSSQQDVSPTKQYSKPASVPLEAEKPKKKGGTKKKKATTVTNTTETESSDTDKNN